MDNLGTLVVAAGALGTAAMGIVEIFFKGDWPWCNPPLGFDRLRRNLRWAEKPLRKAYGEDYLELIQHTYRNGRSAGELPRLLRQAVRIGLDRPTAIELEKILLAIESREWLTQKERGEADIAAAEPSALAVVIDKIEDGQASDLDDVERNVLGRFEVAADARIDAAMSLAENAYKSEILFRALLVSIAIALAAAYTLEADYLQAVVLGIAAVPLAPIAKDISKALQAATQALGKKA